MMRASGLFGSAMGAGRYYILDLAFASWDPSIYVTICLAGSDDLNLEAIVGGSIPNDVVGGGEYTAEDAPTGMVSLEDDGSTLLYLDEGRRQRRRLGSLAAVGGVLSAKLRLEDQGDVIDALSQPGALPPRTLRIAGRGVVHRVTSVSCSTSAFSPPLPSPPPPPPAIREDDSLLWSAAATASEEAAKDLAMASAAATAGAVHTATRSPKHRASAREGSTILMLLGAAGIFVLCAVVAVAVVRRRQERGYVRASSRAAGKTSKRGEAGGGRRGRTSRERSSPRGGHANGKAKKGRTSSEAENAKDDEERDEEVEKVEQLEDDVLSEDDSEVTDDALLGALRVVEAAEAEIRARGVPVAA